MSEFAANYLNLLQFTNSKKNSFRGPETIGGNTVMKNELNVLIHVGLD